MFRGYHRYVQYGQYNRVAKTLDFVKMSIEKNHKSFTLKTINILCKIMKKKNVTAYITGFSSLPGPIFIKYCSVVKGIIA